MRISFQLIIALVALINLIHINALNVSFSLLTSDAAFGNHTLSSSLFLTTSEVTHNDTHYPINSFIVFATISNSSSDVLISSNAITWQRMTDFNQSTNAVVPALLGPSICQHPISGELFVLGGEMITNNQSYISRDQGVSWYILHNNKSTDQWIDRLSATCSITSNHQVIALAGLSGSSSIHGDVNAFDMDSDSSISTGVADWCMINSHAFAPRFGHATVTVRNQGADCIDVIYVIGGSNSTYLFNDVMMSQDDGLSWFSVTTSAAFSPRLGHAVAAASNGLLALSGGESVTGLMDDLYLSFDGGFAWLLVTNHAGFAPRRGHSMIFDESTALYVVGGDDLADVWSLNNKQVIDMSNLNATFFMLTQQSFNESCASLSSLSCSDVCSESSVDQQFLIEIACAVLGFVIILVVLLLVGFHARRPRSDPEREFTQQYDSFRDVDEEKSTEN